MCKRCPSNTNPKFVSDALKDDRLLEQTAQSIDIDVTILRNKLRDAWYSDRNRFDEATLNVLWEIERTGGYSIAQTELIADAIRATTESKLSSETTAKHVLHLISVGESFDRPYASTNKNT